MSGQEEGRPHDGPETAENAFALAFPKGDESFPVLKAFQEFLVARGLSSNLWIVARKPVDHA